LKHSQIKLTLDLHRNPLAHFLWKYAREKRRYSNKNRTKMNEFIAVTMTEQDIKSKG